MASRNKFNYDLEKISNQFLCGFMVNKINFKNLLSNIEWDDQLTLLNQTICHPIYKTYPINRKYQTYFLKTLIDQLEKQNIEIHDQLYESYCNLINLRIYTSDSTTNKIDETTNKWSYKHYRIDNEIITIRESINYISNGTTGLCTWQASLALIEWILNNRDLFKNMQVLELGSGTGLLGFVIGKFCNVQRMTLSDCNEQVLNLMEENLKINFKEPERNKIDIINLPWENFNYKTFINLLSVDILVAADIVYDDSLFEPLLNVVTQLLSDKQRKRKFYIASTIRNEVTFKKFYDLVMSLGLTVKEEHVPVPEEQNSGQMYWDRDVPIKILCIEKNN